MILLRYYLTLLIMSRCKPQFQQSYYIIILINLVLYHFAQK